MEARDPGSYINAMKSFLLHDTKEKTKKIREVEDKQKTDKTATVEVIFQFQAEQTDRLAKYKTSQDREMHVLWRFVREIEGEVKDLKRENLRLQNENASLRLGMDALTAKVEDTHAYAFVGNLMS